MGKFTIYYKWSFSIAILNYQRVAGPYITTTRWGCSFRPQPKKGRSFSCALNGGDRAWSELVWGTSWETIENHPVFSTSFMFWPIISCILCIHSSMMFHVSMVLCIVDISSSMLHPDVHASMHAPMVPTPIVPCIHTFLSLHVPHVCKIVQIHAFHT